MFLLTHKLYTLCMPKSVTKKPFLNTRVLWILLLVVAVGLGTTFFVQKKVKITKVASNLVSESPIPNTNSPWHDLLDCQNRAPAKTANWLTFSKEGVSFKYPSYWTIGYNSQIFQDGDLVSGNYQETNNVTFKGGGGFKARGISLYVMKPKVVDNGTTLEKWVQNNIIFPLKQSNGLNVQPNSNLFLGNEKAIGMYLCGQECMNQLYTFKNGKIYGIIYTVREDYQATDLHDFKTDLCTAVSTFKISE